MIPAAAASVQSSFGSASNRTWKQEGRRRNDSTSRSESIGSSKEKGWTAPLSACSLLAGRNRSAIDVGKGGSGGVCSLSRKKLSGPETGQSATTHIQSKVWDSWFSSRSCRTCCKPDRIRSVPRARHDPLTQIDRVGRRPGPSTVGVSASEPLATTSQPNPIHSYSTLDLGPGRIPTLCTREPATHGGRPRSKPCQS